MSTLTISRPEVLSQKLCADLSGVDLINEGLARPVAVHPGGINNDMNTLHTMHRDSMRNWARQYRALVSLGDYHFASFALQMAIQHRAWAAEERRRT